MTDTVDRKNDFGTDPDTTDSTESTDTDVEPTWTTDRELVDEIVDDIPMATKAVRDRAKQLLDGLDAELGGRAPKTRAAAAVYAAAAIERDSMITQPMVADAAGIAFQTISDAYPVLLDANNIGHKRSRNSGNPPGDAGDDPSVLRRAFEKVFGNEGECA